MNWPLHIVDVFAAERYAGNPLAVVFAAEGALDAATMQRIALETNYSETTFVAPQALPGDAWRVRMFTPAREIAFAGHPILGTAWAIRRHLAPAAQALTLRLMQDDVHVRFAREADGADVAWFRAPPVTLGRRVDAARVAAALGLDAADIDPRAPVRQCAAGTAALVVPLASAAALARARLDLAAFAPLAAAGFAPLTYLVCREARAPQNQLRARFFFEAHGVREDPATGNGAAFLGHWLLEHGWLGAGDLDLRIEQGEEVQRPSCVRLRAHAATREVSVGGQVVATVSGVLV